MGAHAKCISEQARSGFLSFLDGGGEEIVLVMDPPLIDAIDVLFKFSELQARGVKSIIPWTASVPVFEEISGAPYKSRKYIFMCVALSRRCLGQMTWLASFIKTQNQHKKQFSNLSLIFSPFVPELALNRLKSEGIDKSIIEIHSTDCLLLVPVEDDTILIPLDNEALFADFNCRSDPSLLTHVAFAMQRLQHLFGVGVGLEEVARAERKIRKISSIGTASKFVVDQFSRMTDAVNDRIIDEQYGACTNNSDEESNSSMMTGFDRIGGIDSVSSLLLPQNACAKQHHYSSFSSLSPSNTVDNDKGLSLTDAIDSAVLIDRRSDLFSLLCSQFTYEALIDEEVGIKNRRVVYGQQQPSQIMVLTNYVDPLFSEIRDVSVSLIGQLLSKKAAFIAQCYKEKDALKSISEIKDFMDKFKEIQDQHSSLTNHVSLATVVSELTRDPNYIHLLKVEDQIMSMAKPVGKILLKIESLAKRASEVPLFTLERILKLLSLTTLVYGPKLTTNAGLDKTVKTVVHQFGFDAIQKFHHLEQCGLVKFHNPAEAAGVMSELISSGSKWPKIREEFKLITSSETLPDELAEPYSGYIPISVRLVQLLNQSWKASAEKLNLLRGPALEMSQSCPIAPAAPGNTVNVAVVFIGGVTYGEIAALRKLSALESGKRRFLIVTTGITSYKKIIQHM